MSKSTEERWHRGSIFTIYDEDETAVAYAETRAACKRIVVDHNACLGIEDAATTVPELMAVAKAAIASWRFMEINEALTERDRQMCSVGLKAARTVLAKTGQKP